MFRIYESCYTVSLLDFCDHMKCHSGLTAGFGSVDLYDPALRNSSESQCYIQAQAAGGYGLDIHMSAFITELHNGALTEILLNLCKCRLQCLLSVIIGIYCLDLFISSHFVMP